MGKDWNAYAATKAAEAFAPAGQQQVARYADKASAWRREEARDAQTIQRAYERAGIEILAEHKHQQTPQAKQKGMEM